MRKEALLSNKICLVLRSKVNVVKIDPNKYDQLSFFRGIYTYYTNTGLAPSRLKYSTFCFQRKSLAGSFC